MYDEPIDASWFGSLTKSNMLSTIGEWAIIATGLPVVWRGFVLVLQHFALG
jgi:hypothetical protein